MIDKEPINTFLPDSFYLEEDVLKVAKALLGKILVTDFNGQKTAGLIVETEAYRGSDDKASHAFPMKNTNRTKIMFSEGGHSYVYLCYGLHHLFNVVTGPLGTPNAVLIRAIEPLCGIDEMLKRRKLLKVSSKICSGPACLTQALGIDKQWNGFKLTSGHSVWIEDGPRTIPNLEIGKTTRVGVAYAGEDAKLPWRFFLIQNAWVSSYPKTEFISL